MDILAAKIPQAGNLGNFSCQPNGGPVPLGGPTYKNILTTAGSRIYFVTARSVKTHDLLIIIIL